MNYSLSKVKDKIWHLKFKDQYDMCMCFLRYQEFYESPVEHFKNKQFTIIDYMDWYSKNMGDGIFTYPLDWAGFNVPTDIIDKVINTGIKDFNKYDKVIYQVRDHIKLKDGNGCYLIGSLQNNKKVLDHEMAHALYYTIPEYKKLMDQLTDSLPNKKVKKALAFLSQQHYDDSVLRDEFQAYMSESLKFAQNFQFDDNTYKKYKTIFKKYNRQLCK